MATEYVVADVTERIQDRINELGWKVQKAIRFGRDFTCYVSEINCLTNIKETINDNSDVVDADIDSVISDLFLRFNI